MMSLRVIALLLVFGLTANTAPSSDATDFKCNDGTSISVYWLCDNVKDCSDGSDERHCNYLHQCNADEFMCKSGECIKAAQKCNGKDECSDSSDERGCHQSLKSGEAELPSAGDFEHEMGHVEVKRTNAPEVTPSSIFRSSSCPQRNASLYFTNDGSSIARLRINGSLQKPELMAGDLVSNDLITSFAYKQDIDEVLFVTKRSNNQIHAIKSNGDVRSFANHENEHFGRIAVDPLTQNIYFTEDGFGIGACDKNASKCVTLVEASSHEQRFSNLILFPRRGVMFWIEHGSESTVKIAGMDGRISRHLGYFDHVHAIALDAENELLLIAQEDSIVQVDLRTLTHVEFASIRASALAFYNCDLYYVQRDIPSLRVYNNRREEKELAQLTSSNVALLVVPDNEKPLPFANPCLEANCPEVCTLTESLIEPEARCVCRICSEFSTAEVKSSSWGLGIKLLITFVLLSLIGVFLIVYFRLWPGIHDRINHLFGWESAHNTSDISVGFKNSDIQ